MRHFKTILFTAILIAGFTSCDKDDDPQLLNIESKQVTNLHAPQTTDYSTNPPTVTGDFVKFDFSSGETTTSDTDWDIAFRGTTILVNGGETTGLSSEPSRTGSAAAYIESTAFQNLTSVDESKLNQDGANGLAISTGSGNGWYTYNPTTHIITATPGKVLVFKTADNKYAKVEILSYYKDSDDSNLANSRHYTFNYIYQPNEGIKSFN